MARTYGPSSEIIMTGKASGVELAMIDKKIADVMARFINIAAALDTNNPEYKTAINYTAVMLRDAMRARAEQSKDVHYRYEKGIGGGKIVATYMPGNLRRSIKILRHMDDSRNVYVGVEVQPAGKGKGVFSGERTDGWYARFLEYNPGSKPFIRPAILENEGKVKQRLEAFVKKMLDKEYKKFQSYQINW